jgi:hypothetical protein
MLALSVAFLAQLTCQRRASGTPTSGPCLTQCRWLVALAIGRRRVFVPKFLHHEGGVGCRELSNERFFIVDVLIKGASKPRPETATSGPYFKCSAVLAEGWIQLVLPAVYFAPGLALR